MDFHELVASRVELEATIWEVQGKVTDLWRINQQPEERIKDLEKHNEDRNVKFEATKHRLTRTEVTIRALEAKVKIQKAHAEDLKEDFQQQQGEIKALKTQEKSDQLEYAAKVSELKRENSVQAVEIAELEKAKSNEASGVKANFSFLQSKLLRIEFEYKFKIAELNTKNLRQKVKMRDCIKEIQGKKADQEAEIETPKEHLQDKEDLISKLPDIVQTSESLQETQSQRVALLEAQIKTLEAKSSK
ncbi:hypothetical protein ACKRZS_006271 [Fusarium odoratissimum]